jgi:hypothetical protein
MASYIRWGGGGGFNAMENLGGSWTYCKYGKFVIVGNLKYKRRFIAVHRRLWGSGQYGKSALL